MNLTDIKPIQHDLLSQYDIANRDLHRAILDRRNEQVIKAKQEVVLKVRNQIAERLIKESWSSTPEHQRF